MNRQQRELDQLSRLDPDLAERYAARMKPADRVERVERETAGLPRSPITYEEREALLALSRCRFGYGWSNAQRFVRDMTAVYTSDDPQITEAQRRYLWKLVYRFRRQIGEDSQLVKEAKQRIWE